MSIEPIVFEKNVEECWERLDLCASRECALFARSQFRQRVLAARINGKPARASMGVNPGDTISIEYLPEKTCSLEPENIPIDIIYEDKNVLVLNKSRGMVVHPGAGHPSGTLVNAFLHHARLCSSDFSAENVRPGIVHRLDKDTTGVIIIARNDSTLNFLAGQFRDRETEKTYLALVEGIVGEAGEITGCIRRSTHSRILFTHDPLRGKPARSRYTPLASTPPQQPPPATLMKLQPITGRTHQLRVHAKHLGHPILGDPLYNPNSPVPALMLHAASLKIRLPGHTAPTTFTAPPPEDMREICADYGLTDALSSSINP
ncbi:MAG: RluA family pseudouridine synthase [Salinispira sp.]